jgi:predicted regulator of Ras-like GTPase activity (Roadblock/LC7/MglB family)
MTVSECLDQVAAISGVTAAAVVSEEGYVVEGTTSGGLDLDVLGGLIGSTLGASRALGELLGEGDLQQATIEYRDGPVLVVPLAAEAAGHAVVIALASIAPLGRVRFQLRRLLPEIGTAVAARA